MKNYINVYTISAGIAALLILLLIGLWPVYVVDPGYMAIHQRLGTIMHVRKESGVYIKAPFIDTVVTMFNGIQKQEIETTALSKDLQAISIGIYINYRYVNELELYRATRGQAEEVIIVPFCHESIKAVVAEYTAEELIHNRHTAKEKIYTDLKARLKPHYIDFIEVNFAHADFSHDFMKAVEDKQIALQHAMTAKNNTETVRENSIQQKLVADAEAYAQQVKKSSITKEIAQLKAIEKWDGVLPKVVNGSVPFISMEI